MRRLAALPTRVVAVAVLVLAACGENENGGVPAGEQPTPCVDDTACPTGTRCVEQACAACDPLELPYDGVDNDCNESSRDSDLDFDGENWVDAPSDPGTDCDDQDALIHPGAQDVCGDGKDNDCNGTADDRCDDQSPPTVVFLTPAPDEVLSGIVQVAIQATDASGIASVELLVDGARLGLLEAEPYRFTLDTTTIFVGAHLLEATAVDLAGKSATAVLGVMVDNRPPTVSFVRPAFGERRGGNVTLVATAEGPAAIANVVFLVDGGEVGTVLAAPYELQLDTLPLPDGPHVVSAIATDEIDLQGRIDLTVTVDNSPPALSFTGPAAGTFVSDGVDVELAATDPAGIAWIRSEGEQAAASPLTYRLDLAGSPEGPLRISATAADRTTVDDVPGSGNEASAELQLVVDRTPPLLAVTAPAAGSVVSGLLDVVGTASDAVTLASVRLLVDGVPSGLPVPPAPAFQLAFDSATVADGPHTLTVEALDAVGNAARIDVAVDVDNGAPTVALVRPTAGPSRGGTMTVEVTVADTLGVDHVDVLVDGVAAGTVSGAGPALSLVVDTRAFADGTRALQAVVVDRAGNSATVATSVVVDNTAPAVSFAAPAAGVSLTGTVAVQVVATDASGIASLDSEGASAVTSPLDYLLDLQLEPDGARLLTATAADTAVVDDGAGANVGSATLGVVVDATPPSVTLAAPLPGTPVSGTVSVVASASDANGVVQVQLFVDGLPLGDSLLAPGPYQLPWDSVAAGDGPHELRAEATDAAGNRASFTATVEADNSGPLVSLDSPGAGELRGGTMTLRASAIDPSGVSLVELRIDGALVAGSAVPPFEAVLDTTAYADGAHLLEAVAVDANGYSRTVSLPVTIDNTPPAVAFAAPAPGATYGSGVDVQVTATDASGLLRIDSEGNSAVASPLSFRHSLLGSPEGPFLLTASATDLAVRDDGASPGNSAAATVTISVDHTPPALTVTAPSAGSSLTGLVDVTGTASDAVGLSSVMLLLDGVPTGAPAPAAPGFSISWDTAAVADGAHTLSVEAVDLAGNATRIDLAVEIDNQPPVVVLVRPSAGPSRGGTMTVEVDATDADGVDRLEVLVDGVLVGTVPGPGPSLSLLLDTRAFADGARALEVVGYDLAGHAGSASSTVVVDNTPPAVSFTAPAPGANRTGIVPVQVVATDASGLSSLVSEGASGAASPLDYLLDLSLDPDGPRLLTATAVDAAVVDDGAGANVGTATLALVVDGTPPAVSLTAPLEGATLTGTTLVVASASDLNAVAQVQFFVDGLPLGAPILAPPYQLSWDTVAAGDGPHVLLARATDAAGNSASFSASVVADNAGPLVSFLSPGAGELRGGTMTLRADATDPSGVARVELRIDGALAATVLAAPYQTVIDTAGYSDGSHLLEAVAVDTTGLSRTVSRSVTIDNTRPAVAFAAPAAGAPFRAGVDVQVTASDANGVLRIDSEGNSSAVSPLSYRRDLLATPDGPLLLAATATDRAVRDDGASPGNTASTTVTIQVDNSPPLVAIVAPASGAFVRGLVDFTASASDNLAVSRVRLFADAVLLGDLPAPGPYTAQWNAGAAAAGPHTLRAEATDSAGNVATVTIPVIVDLVNPTTCAVSAPAANALVSGTVPLTASGADANGVVRIVFQVDGLPVATGLGSPATAGWSSLAVADGTHTLQAVCFDAAGNSRASASLNLRVDNTIPVVTLTSPLDGEGVFRVTTLSATVTDTNPISRVEFSVNGGVPTVDLAAPYSTTFDFTPLSGVAVVRAQAFDATGNVGVAVANVQVIPRAGFRIAELWPGTGTLGTGGFTVADLTGDGLPELLIGGGELSLRRSTGTGFDPAVRISGLTTVVSVATADLDGDGDLDLQALKGSSLELLANQGGGVFAAPVSVALGAIQASELTVGDLDGDGDPDVVVSQGAAGGDVKVLRNSGGVLALVATLGNLGSATDVRLADVEPDGDLDVVVGRSGAGNNRITVFRNDGSGVFAGGQDTTTSAPPEKLAIGDLDGSGAPEILVTMLTLDRIAILTATGPGNYLPGPDLVTRDAPSGVALGDFDGDGDQDAVITSNTGNGFEVWTNAAGALAPTALYTSGRTAGRPLLVDVDSDLRLDLLHASPGDGALALARGGGDGTFSAAPSFTLPGAVGDRTPRAIAVGELCGGGGPDLAVAVDAVAGPTPEPQEVRVMQNLGGNQFYQFAQRGLVECGGDPCLLSSECEPGFTCTGPVGSKVCCAPALPQVTSVAIGDLDGLNTADVAVGTAATTGSSAALLPADPLGDLGIRTVFALDLPLRTTFARGLPKPLDVQIADLDNDGVGEAIFSADGGAGLDGAMIVGATGAMSLLASGDGAAGVLVTDLDGDGDRDLAVANSVTDNISVHFWDGAALGLPTLFSTIAGINTLGFGLTAGDARGDLIGLGATQAVLLPGDPAFTFAAPTAWPTGAGPSKLVVDDFNGDGLADALVLRAGSNLAAILIARPQGGFFAPDPVSLPSGPADLGLGDLDGNGRADVVVTATGSKQVTLLVNDL